MNWEITGLDHTLEGVMICDLSSDQSHDGDNAKEYIATVYDEINAQKIILGHNLLKSLENNTLILFPSEITPEITEITQRIGEIYLQFNPNDYSGAMLTVIQALLDFGKQATHIALTDSK